MIADRLAPGIKAFLARNWIALSVGAAVTAAFELVAGRLYALLTALVAGVLFMLFGLAIGALVQNAFKAVRGNHLERRALIAYAPAGLAVVAYLLAKSDAANVVRSGSLNDFYGAAAPLLGVLLISIVLETRQLAPHDPWLRAFRAFWFLFIVIGIVYALLGLTPDQSTASLDTDFEAVWAGLVGAITALLAVAVRPAPRPHHPPTGHRSLPPATPATWAGPVTPKGLSQTSAPTRTPARSTPASRRAARR
jgi:hypothetical protein